MNELIKTEEMVIGGEMQLGVSGRELHEFLEIETPYHKWVKRRIEEAQLEKGVDYEVLDKFVQNSKGGRPSEDHAFSLDSGKNIGMLERNEKGKAIRKYFIDVEKEYHKQPKPALSVADNMLANLPEDKRTFLLFAKMSQKNPIQFFREEMREAKKTARLFGFTGNQATLSAVAHVQSVYGINLYNSLGEKGLISKDEQKDNTINATQIGKRLGGHSPRVVNRMLETMGFQHKGEDGNWIITKEGKKYGESLDVPKQYRSDGTPVKQWKWYERVVDLIRDSDLEN